MRSTSPRATEKHQELVAGFAYQILVQGVEQNTFILIRLRVFCFETLGDDVHLFLCFVDRHAVPQPADGDHPVGVSVVDQSFIEGR